MQEPHLQGQRELLITQDSVHWVTRSSQHLEHSRSPAIVGQPQASGLTRSTVRGVPWGTWKQLLIWSVLESFVMAVKFTGHKHTGRLGKKGLEITRAPASCILGKDTSSPCRCRIDQRQLRKISDPAGIAAEIWEANRLQHSEDYMTACNGDVARAHHELWGFHSSSHLCLYELKQSTCTSWASLSLLHTTHPQP